MSDRHRDIVLATDSATPSGVGEHMLTLAGARAGTHAVALVFPKGHGGALPRPSRAAGFEMSALDENFAEWLKLAGRLLHVHAGIGWEGHELAADGLDGGHPRGTNGTSPLPSHRPGPEFRIAWPLALPTRGRRVGSRRRLSSAQGCVDSARSATGLTYRVEVGPGRRPVRSSVSTTMPRRDHVARFTAQKGHDDLAGSCRRRPDKLPEPCSSSSATGRRERQWWSWRLPRPCDVAFLGERRTCPSSFAAADSSRCPRTSRAYPSSCWRRWHGLPVVATRIGGTVVQALGQDHPFLVPHDSPSLIATAIVTALRDEVESRNVAIQSKQRFLKRFTATRMAQETRALYRALTKGVCVA